MQSKSDSKNDAQSRKSSMSFSMITLLLHTLPLDWHLDIWCSEVATGQSFLNNPTPLKTKSRKQKSATVSGKRSPMPRLMLPVGENTPRLSRETKFWWSDHQQKKKIVSQFDPTPHMVTDVQGSCYELVADNYNNVHTIFRHISDIKLCKPYQHPAQTQI